MYMYLYVYVSLFIFSWSSQSKCKSVCLHVPLFMKICKNFSLGSWRSHTNIKFRACHSLQGFCFGLFFVPFCLSLIFDVLVFLKTAYSFHIKLLTDVPLIFWRSQDKKMIWEFCHLGIMWEIFCFSIFFHGDGHLTRKSFRCYFGCILGKISSVSWKIFNILSWTFAQVFVYYSGNHKTKKLHCIFSLGPFLFFSLIAGICPCRE